MAKLQSKFKGRDLITAFERVVWATALCLLAWISLSGSDTRSELKLATSRAIQVAELRGTLSYLDEWLTMSARMAAATGNERWVERYNEASPKLAAAVAEALTVATPEVAGALVTTTEEAWNGLHQMQVAALKMAVAGDKAAALELLESSDYSYLQEVYQSGIDNFGRDLTALSQARSASLNKRVWLEAAALFLGTILFVAMLLTKRSRRRLSIALANTEKVARTDPLTQLPNRRKLFEDLQELTSGSAPGQVRLAFLMLDLDRFKAINDAHGHPVGDDLLKLVAVRLQATVGPDDLVARLGGDEFAIIASVGDAQAGAEAAITHLVERIVTAFKMPFTSRSGIMLQVDTSIGVAFFDRDVRSVEDLTHRADAALYRAKNGGRNRACFFDGSIDRYVREDAKLETSLRHAIENDALIPNFQPLLELKTRRLIGFEMLARWPLPDGSLVSPAEFIPIAEKTNLIAPLTERLMRSAFQSAAAWPGKLTLACNLSPLLLRDHTFIDMLRALLTETGFPADQLELEITESALLEDLTLVGTLMRELKNLGVSLALDDFGTGFSSLRHLRSLPLDKLKIDAGFVAGMDADAESRVIVEAVVGLGRNLGMVTVAEGVETEETAAMLAQMGCNLGQGWLFGRPCPAAAAKDLVDQIQCVSERSDVVAVDA